MAASISALAQTATPPSTSTDQTSMAAQPAVNAPAEPKKADEVVVLNEFTVNGSYAGSLEMAANLKQNSSAVVEVIAPEDIGKLPDVSIADSLTRLTGLTTQRTNGRSQAISIRGGRRRYS